MGIPVKAYRSKGDWQWDWEEKVPLPKRKSKSDFREIAAFVAGGLHEKGFKLFENGGTPLLLRYFGPLREEILLAPAPRMWTRPDMPFTAMVYLSNPELGKVRSRFWRPATRAPHVIASGNIGALEALPVHYIFEASAGLECASIVSRLISGHVLPWLEVFHDPERLRSRIYDGDLPLIDESTAMELLLVHFDPFEARQYLRRYRELHIEPPAKPIHEVEGYNLHSSRIEPIRAYYKLDLF